MPTLEDVNPNTRFIDNQVIKVLLEDNVELNKYLRDNKLSWANYPVDKETLSESYSIEILRKVYGGEETGFAHDKIWLSKF